MALCYYITARRQLEPLPGPDGPERALQEKVRAAFQAAVDYVQVREKDLPGGRLFQLLENLRRLPEKGSSRLLVNERLDVAITAAADGVHLPADSLPLPAVRSRAGDSLQLGISCHSEQEVEQAGRDGASYVLLGPVFETPSKPGVQPLGLSSLAAICQRQAVPIFALGGIDLRNAASCIGAGAKGVAGIRLFQQAPDLEELCRFLHSL